MKIRVIAWLLIAGAAVAAADDPPLRPVADPRPILEDLQRKMSSLRSVYLDFTQERHLPSCWATTNRSLNSSAPTASGRNCGWAFRKCSSAS